MNYQTLLKKITLVLLPAMVIGYATSCKKTSVQPEEKPTYSWVEEFDTVQTALNKGWVVTNNSRPLGAGSWSQGSFVYANGKLTGFPASSYRYSGSDYVYCGFNCGADLATLSAWLISPPSWVKNGDTLYFHTRTSHSPASYADRLEVRMNAIDDAADVGNGPLQDSTVASAVGKFTTLMLDINPRLLLDGPDGYPEEWVRYTLPVKNLDKPGYHRFAFRYFVTSGGPSGTNSDGVGIDSVAFVSK